MTTKQRQTRRINITLSEAIIKQIKYLAEADKENQMSPTAKAAELIKIGLEIEDDKYLSAMAEERVQNTPDSEYLDESDFWKVALS